MDGRPASDILRKLIVLGGRAESGELRSWASQELRGYPDDAILPEYRQVRALIQMNSLLGFTQIPRQTIGAEAFPEHVRQDITNEVSFRHGIGEIQSMISARGADQSMRFALPGETIIAKLMHLESGKTGQVISLYRTVSATALEGIVDQVKQDSQNYWEIFAPQHLLTEKFRPPTEPLTQSVSSSGAAATEFKLRMRPPEAPAQRGTGSRVEEQERPFWTLGKRIGAIVGRSGNHPRYLDHLVATARRRVSEVDGARDIVSSRIGPLREVMVPVIAFGP